MQKQTYEDLHDFMTNENKNIIRNWSDQKTSPNWSSPRPWTS